ncbi:MAG: hypothetical protein IKI11_07845 [Neisseriaceae bacterium]|nr:hypothetical protein [Neisseriaceae bacterium]
MSLVSKLFQEIATPMQSNRVATSATHTRCDTLVCGKNAYGCLSARNDEFPAREELSGCLKIVV